MVVVLLVSEYKACLDHMEECLSVVEDVELIQATPEEMFEYLDKVDHIWADPSLADDERFCDLDLNWDWEHLEEALNLEEYIELHYNTESDHFLVYYCVETDEEVILSKAVMSQFTSWNPEKIRIVVPNS